MNKMRVLLVALALTASDVAAQSLPDGSMDATPVDRENPLAVWLDAIQPGDPHKALAERTGRWTVVYRSWFKPGQSAAEVTGVVERSMILDGRVLEEEMTLPLPGQEYRGVSYIGYDNVTEQYWWQRLDNMSTWITRSGSSTRGEGGEIVFEVPILNHSSGEVAAGEVILRTEPDREVYEWYQPDPSGDVFKSIEYIYTRSPDPAGGAAPEAVDESPAPGAVEEDPPPGEPETGR